MIEIAYYYFPPLLTLTEFFQLGGPVLILIALTGFTMWCLLFERIFFLSAFSVMQRNRILNEWNKQASKTGWSAEQIRACWSSQYSQQLERNMLSIKTCISVAPLLGLLGTVTGMIEVFDVMATSGLGNARAMSDGIAKATVPTMAGMIISLSGFMVITFIQQKITAHHDQLLEHFTH